jgi:hypothetical protein
LSTDKRKEDGMRVSPEVLDLAHKMACEMAAQGAEAVLLMGSQVRGDPYSESDIDLRPIGEDREAKLERRGQFLVSVYWQSADSVRKLFRDPCEAGGIVPALRGAYALYDPDGVAAQLRREAEAWSWDAIDEQCDAWVAEQITGYAEEVHRLVGNLRLGRVWAAAVVRCVLSFRMGMILAVHHRILYETENRLWDLVGEVMGDRWRPVQGTALGTGQESFQETCDAALELYALVGSEVKHLFDARQRDVVAHACRIAGYPLSCG